MRGGRGGEPGKAEAGGAWQATGRTRVLLGVKWEPR